MKNPPGNEFTVFDSAINRIKKQGDDDIKFAIHVFTWLIYSAQPLTTTQLVHSFAIHFSDNASNRHHDRSEEHLIFVCQGLVVVEPKTKVVRTIHESVHSHIERQKLVHENPQDFITSQCLKYLLSEEFREPVVSEEEFKSRRRECALLDFAATRVDTHLRSNEKPIEEGIETLATDLLKQPGSLRSWFQIIRNDPQAQIASLPAAIYLNLETVAENLISGGVDVNDACSKKHTALHWAARLGSASSVEFLLRNNAHMDLKDAAGNTPLHKAVINEHLKKDINRYQTVIELLITADPAQMNTPNGRKHTPFTWATKHSPECIVNLLVEHQPIADPDSSCDRFYSILQDLEDLGLSSSEKTGIIKKLLSRGTSLCQLAIDGWHPLIHAAKHGEREIANLLLEHGAPTDVEDVEGYTPLQQAILNGHDDVVHLLISQKADVNRMHRDGFTPLIQAARNRQGLASWLLLENGSNQNERDQTGSTSLHYAVQNDDASLVWLLVLKEANVDVRNITGLTPLDLAVINNNSSLAPLLLDRGALINGQDLRTGGLTALHHAVKQGHEHVADLLLRNSADPDVQDGEGVTALMYATSQGNRPIMRKLISHGASLNIQDTAGATALHRSIGVGVDNIDGINKSILILRLHSGAPLNPNLPDHYQKTPLMLAAQAGSQWEVLCLLEVCGADSCLRDAKGRTARDLAEAEGHEGVVRCIDEFLSGRRSI